MEKGLGKILVVDDDDDVRLAARLLLKPHASLVQTEKDPQILPSLLLNEAYDIILLDMNFAQDATSGREGFYWLGNILERDPSAVVILITAYGDVESAVRAIKQGATDFVLKPWQNEKLLATLSAAARLRRSQLEVADLRLRQKNLSAAMDRPFHDLIGASPAIQKVFAEVRKVAATDADVLILGENGTGKELVARALHRDSARAGQVFVSVDMGTVHATLFESELFGHVKGAFTDALEDRAGRFEVASGGTLFLDEIGNLPLASQAKLLTVLENRTVTRLGSNLSRPIDVRLICATNMPVHDMVARNEFRRDLLYRINTVEIQVPPLRERPEDIPLLTGHFLDIYCRKYHKPPKQLHPAAHAKLELYPWPGNVRELRHALERAVIMTDARLLQPADLLLTTSEATSRDGLVFEDYNLETVERTVIRKAVTKHGGNISHAARELGLTRSALYRRLEKYGL